MMKKFLSSLLALTMILSLVIVPANAANAEIEGVSVSADSIKLKVGGSTILKVNIPNKKSGDTLKIGGEDAKLQSDITLSNVTSSNPKVATVEVDKSNNNVTVTAADQGTATITYTVSCNYKNKWDLNTSATQTLKTEITVEPEKLPVTYTYSVEGNATVTGKDTVASGTPITFTADTSAIKVYKTASTEGAKPEEVKTGVEYAYKWDDGPTEKTLSKTYNTNVPSKKETVSCTVTVSVKGTDFTKPLAKASKTVTVTNSAVDKAQADFEEAVKKAGFTYRDRATTLNNNVVTYIPFFGDKGNAAVTDFELAKDITGFGNVTIKKNGDNGFTVKGKKDAYDVSVDFTFKRGTAPAVTFTTDLTGAKTVDKATVLLNGDITVTASTDLKNAKFKWTNVDKNVFITDAPSINFNKNNETNKKQVLNLVCNVYEDKNDTIAAQATFTLTVSDAAYVLTVEPGKSITLNQTDKAQTLTAKLVDKDNASVSAKDVTYSFTTTDKSIINLKDNKDGTATVSLKQQGNATITVKASYKGAEYEETISIIGTQLSGSLEKVKNGEKLEISYNDLKTLAADAINKRGVTVSGNIKVLDAPKTANSGGALYRSSTSTSALTNPILSTGDSVVFKSTPGFIGTYSMKVSVNGSDGVEYVITVSIPVVPADTIKGSVVGTEAKKDVTFTNDDYEYLYYTTSKVSDFTGYYDGSKVSKFDGPVKEDKTVTIPASAFKDKSSVTLNVVGVDKDGVASTGTIEVSQKSYNIEYSVVAGESISFAQKHFESFMNDYADDNIDTNRGDYFELQYVKFDSLPNSTREGVLYEGKDKIKTSTEVEDLDKVTFESVAKAKDTIKVPFTLYAKQYDKNDKVIDKKVSMTGVVEISVVKEDIVFEVGVNSAVKLGSDKFIDFLRDSDKSYRKADLDYVTFDVGKNSAITSYFNGTGALYRYYNGNTGINATVSAKDEFYYNPKTSSKHYDLDDVTYVTSKFAKVGDIVYIPFTAYGTKSGQKAEGTLAIKVKQTMNFVDVHTYDYFYDSVQWAVNLGIAKGTSATTFSPKTGCTRAQIVTFLWRAANSPEPRSSTSKFTDVYATTHADYMKAINWATEQGITTGTGNGKFSPDATCTRAQIVTFLYRFKGNPAVYGSLNFSDVNKTEHAAFYNAILWAVNNKITTGYGGGIFDPNGTCNRGDAVTFLYRALA